MVIAGGTHSTAAGFWVGRRLNRSLHFILCSEKGSSGENRAKNISKQLGLLTGVGTLGGVVGGIVEL